MIEVCSSTMPVVSPMTPTPPKSPKVSDPESKTERESDSAPKNPGHGIPARVGDNRCPVHQPRIISGHVDHFWIGRFNDDRAALRGHLLLFVAVQMASTAGLLTQGLHRICDILRLVDICLAER